MTILFLSFSVFSAVLSVAAYRLGIADGISATRQGRLAGRREKKEDLLTRIDAYDGRKERHG